jgi:hypothetical protein
MKDEMALYLTDDYESPTISSFGFVAQALDEIYVDDLRAENDNSLELVPFITSFFQLQSYFKLDISTLYGGDIVEPGGLYFKLVGFYIRTGVAAFVPKVLDENGNPLAGIFVWANWPTADQLPQGTRLVPDYSNNFNAVGGFTNANGDIGFGYGGGAVVGGDGGVYRIWPSADPEGLPRQWADCGIKLGWFGGTDHLTANPIFQVVEVPGDGPPATGDTEHTLVQLLDGVEISRTVITVETALKVK